MSVNNGLLSPNLRVPAQGTHQAVPSPHAAFVRPCARNPCCHKQASRAQEEDVVIVVGPQGPRIQFYKPKKEGESYECSNTTH